MALERLPVDDEKDYRTQFMGELDVASWSSPISVKVVPTVKEGPWWWHGDEDASQSFLAAMGVDLSDGQ